MSSLAIFFSACQGILPIIFIVVLITLLVKKSSFSIKPFGIGILVFVVFLRVLESILHLIILKTNHTTSAFFAIHPIAYAIYAALAAGIFEEVGRYVGFRVLLKKFRAWKDGISYGLGHGGIEALLIGTVMSIEAIVIGLLVNKGQLPANLPADVQTQLLAMVHQPAYSYALGTFERIIAICIQLALSLLVLFGIKQRKILYLGVAILLHAVVDFMPALYQRHLISLIIVEFVMIVFGICAITFIIRSKNIYDARMEHEAA